MYDFIHWNLNPIFYQIIKKKINPTIYPVIFFSVIQFLKFKLKNYHEKLHFDCDSIFEILLTNYLLERYLFLNHQTSIKNIDALLDEKEKSFVKKNSNLILKFLIKLNKDKFNLNFFKFGG